MIVIDKRWGGEMCCVCFATPRRGREWEARGGEKRGRRRDFLPVPPTALFLCTAHPVREQVSRFLPLIIVNNWTFLNGPGPAHLKAVWENTTLKLLSFVLESVLIRLLKLCTTWSWSLQLYLSNLLFLIKRRWPIYFSGMILIISNQGDQWFTECHFSFEGMTGMGLMCIP